MAISLSRLDVTEVHVSSHRLVCIDVHRRVSMCMFQRIMQEAVYGALREVAAFSRDVEGQHIRGKTVPLACTALL